MEEAGGAREGLFSLELLVEWVRVEPRLLLPPPRGPLRPAVALRLLDFPTLLVHPPEPGCPPGRLVPFGRGKSCLFRLSPGPLRGLLRRAPLYALLLALPAGPGPARLLGSCCVSLAPAAEELLRPPLGGATPGSRGRRGRYPLRDLMGEQVGELALGYRLSSLGPALLGHLPAGLGREVVGAAPPPSPTCPSDTQRKSRPRPQGPPGQSRHATSVGSQTEPQGRELEPEHSSQVSALAGQTHMPLGEEMRELEIEANTFCPPPLYYNHLPTESPPAQAPGRVAVAQPQVPQEQSPSAPPQEAHPDRGPASGSLAQQLGSAQQLRDALRELPLINALLVELSLLSNQPLQLGPSTVHPQLAWLYREVEDDDIKTSRPLTKSRGPAGKDKETLLNPSERFKRSQQDFSKLGGSSLRETGAGKGTKKAAASRNNGFEKKSGTKENTPPRKKLFYGLTNTLRLRLQQTNPEMLILHERREQYRKRQVEVLRGKKGKGPLPRGKLFRNTAEQHLMSYRHPAGGGILEQNIQLDENIETLIQSSIEKDYSTTITEDISDLQKHAAHNRLNNHEENTKEENPYEVNTNSSLKGTTIKTPYKVKGVKVHLPRAFTQDTDAKRNKVDEEAVHFIHDKDTDDYNASTLGDYQPGPNNSFESNPELKYSDDFVGSPDNAGYSEDFTSADDTGRGSETLDSSPEPALVSPKQACSDMESESKKSRLSEKSLRTESISAPLPVPSTASPVHSLKRTYDLKAKNHSTGAAVGVSISDSSPPAGSLDKQELAPHIKEEDSKIDQNIFQAPEVKSKQTNSDINSVVKGQTSLEKSQSLRTSQVSSYLPSNMSDLELNGVENNTSDKEEDDDFGTLSISNQYKHISELVVNKLPGYTM
ncbi:microtubule associated protein 10 [Chelydra serpentina]|uniref:Microtubule associated protein 10 n=1 Tax=Chelydra serpentina TaxID=8475 RepID=A0A8T1SVQ7_CHESE|nr:microtubule associated protein 10 [Chelydra serpentina]